MKTLRDIAAFALLPILVAVANYHVGSVSRLKAAHAAEVGRLRAIAMRSRPVPIQGDGYELRIDRVVDADTLVGDVYLPWGVALMDRTIRCAGYDACETAKRRDGVTDQEVVVGRKASGALKAMLVDDDGVFIRPAPEQFDSPYSRLLGYVSVRSDGETVRLEEWAEENGYTRTKYK